MSSIILDTSRLITDYDGRVFDEFVRTKIVVGDIVRLSMYISDDDTKLQDFIYETDAPYVNIMNELDGKFLGELISINRVHTQQQYYPIRTGDRIWFEKINVIEYPIKYNETRRNELTPYLKDEYIEITGPLYTIHYIELVRDNNEETSISSCESSDYETEEDIS